jgi:magnesium chelatase family protein
MPVARTLSRAEFGIDAPLVQVEVHLGNGLPAFSIVGLPAPVVRESRERVRSALLNSGYEFPARRIIVNLAPVELSKQGARFDLPIALGVLIASGQVRASEHERFECYGELGLAGELKPVRGLFLAALRAREDGHTLIVPSDNLAEVALSGIRSALGAAHLRAAAMLMSVEGAGASVDPVLETQSAPSRPQPSGANTGGDRGARECDIAADARQGFGPPTESLFGRIVGQWRVKRALIVAAAGGHSVVMIGPPGSGKSLLASCLPALLPPLSHPEALEVASIAALAGLAPDARSWKQRPFRCPHHTASACAVVGGGTPVRPGEISLAHAGVLFLDELPEYDRRVLEALREPLEAGTIRIARASGSLQLPARFQLIAAMNPCPCGYLGETRRECRCTPAQVARYRQRLSGPLLDRIDIRVQVDSLAPDELAAVATSGSGDARPQPTDREREYGLIVQQIQSARSRRTELSGAPCALLPLADLQRCSPLAAAATALFERSCRSLALSARAVRRILALSRTIADLAHSELIESEQLAEAVQLRRALEVQGRPIEREQRSN